MKKKLKLTDNIDSLGWDHEGWQHLDMQADGSENFDFFYPTG